MKVGGLAVIVAAGSLVAMGGRCPPAFSVDLAQGQRLFQQEDTNGRSCTYCHPGGGTNGKVYLGKKVPSLIDHVGELSEEALRAKVRKHLEADVSLQLSDAQFESLVAFVASLPKKGWPEER